MGDRHRSRADRSTTAFGGAGRTVGDPKQNVVGTQPGTAAGICIASKISGRPAYILIA